MAYMTKIQLFMKMQIFIKTYLILEVLNKNLKVMDSTAISLAKESNIPIIVTNLSSKKFYA